MACKECKECWECKECEWTIECGACGQEHELISVEEFVEECCTYKMCGLSKRLTWLYDIDM